MTVQRLSIILLVGASILAADTAHAWWWSTKKQTPTIKETRDAKELERAMRVKKELIKRGEIYFSYQHYDFALQKWEEALLLDPKDTQVQRLIKKVKKKLAAQEKKDVQFISVGEPVRDAARPMNIDECIQIAIANYRPLRIAEKNVKLAKMRIWEAQRNLLPKASIAYEEYSGEIYGRRFVGRKQYIEGQQTLPIWSGAETFYVKKQADINYEVAKNEYEKTRNELVLQVRKAYYSLMKSKENLLVQYALKKEVDVTNEMVKKGYDAGVIAKMDLLNVASQTAQVNFQYVSAESDVTVGELILKQAMYIDPKSTIDIVVEKEFQKIGVDYEETLRAAFAKRPELRINLLTIDYYNYDRQITKKKEWPKLDIMGSWGLAKEEYTSEDFDHDATDGTTDIDRKLEQQWYAGFKVSMPFWGSTGEYSYTREQWVPVVSAVHGTETTTYAGKINLFDKLNIYSDKLQAQIDYERAQQDFEKITQEVTLEVREGCFAYEKALIQLDAAAKKVSYKETEVAFYKLKRGMDEAPDSDVVEKMIECAQEKFGYAQALSDCYIAVATLNKAVGDESYFKIEHTPGTNATTKR